ncbi:Bax inhibitor, putative [Pediculus humanus corporis]|uniref:Bax inhibitor, putative n=1 Tax=Pediculus humanus subsp. corporis TaxID=121224 RepID=E0VG77_PEDHC|nr:Bax inhibitor, putative [Pediculus humanus corporis]EEB12383.1 Bax inhibitor, putative [Pediculus humanus corporis]
MAVSFDRIRRNFNNRIEEPVRKHLRNVYACLALSAASATAGCYLNIYANLMSGGFLTILPALGLLLALRYTAPDGKNNKLRMGYLLVTALVGTILIFSSFSLSVLFAPRGYWLFIGGPISTVLSAMFFLSLANIFFAVQWVYQVNLYVGLLLMCGFVIYDTTIIMEKCRMHDKDFIMHSVDLFIDLVSIFKRLIIILTEKHNVLIKLFNTERFNLYVGHFI